MMKLTIISALSAAALLSCSTAGRIEKQNEAAHIKDEILPPTVQLAPNASLITAMEERKNALGKLDITASVNATLNGAAAPPANCAMTICRYDSLGITFSAFGAPIGKLYARNDYFLFFDAFNNQAIEGKPSAANIGRAINVPLSYSDFTHLLRGEAPGDITLFSLAPESGNTAGQSLATTLFERKTEENGIEFALFSPDKKALVQYQRKDASGAIQLNVRYEDFTTISDGVQVAKKVAIAVPPQNSSITFTASEILVNSKQNKQLKFAAPSSVPRSRLE